MLSLLQTGLHDARMMLSGVRKLARYYREPDPPPESISMFLASTSIVKKGVPARYQLTLANVSTHHAFCRFVVDIYYKDNPVHPEGHYGYFEKSLILEKETSTVVDIEYDWNDSVSTAVNGTPSGPGSAWRGLCSLPGFYYVRAFLFDHSGSNLEEVFVIQELRQ